MIKQKHRYQMMDIIFENKYFECVVGLFVLPNPNPNPEEARFTTYTAAGHQGGMRTFGFTLSSIFICCVLIELPSFDCGQESYQSSKTRQRQHK